MRKWLRRLLATVVCAILAVTMALPTALAEDWREQLRSVFGLSEDYEVETGNASTDDTSQVQQAEPITDAQRIVNYLNAHGRLPENFITKKEARALGWDASYNYVGDVAPGKSIGGDRFGNYEGQLPSKKGRTWYECDINYKGKKRGAERLLYSSDGL